MSATKSTLIFAVVIIAFLGLLIGASYMFGWIGVHQTKTIGKGMQDAKREVFESTQSFVESKKVDIADQYRQWKKADEEDKATIEYYVRTTCMEFDEQKYLDEPLKTFVYNCKYN